VARRRARGLCPIGVKLAAKRIADLRPSSSPGVCKAAMNVSISQQEVVKGESASDCVEQQSRAVSHTLQSEGM
jgi:hypothetical protein